MYIIKQKDNLKERYIEDLNENWTDNPRKAKIWASKALADAYIKFKGYKKCALEEIEYNPEKRGKQMQTKCWGCQNASKCEWAKGKPVPNWEAVPTKIKEGGGGSPVFVDSYLVLECPKFQKLNFESKVEVYERLAKEKGVSPNAMRKRLKRLEEKLNDRQNK